MKKLLFTALLVAAVAGIVVGGLLEAPRQFKDLELKVEGRSPEWKKDVSQFIFTLVQPGEEINEGKLKFVESQIKKLPWVETCEVSFSGTVLKVKVTQRKPVLAILYKRNYYLIGKNGFVLSTQRAKPENLPVYFYKGNSSPFTIRNGFLKMKNTISFEIALLKNRLPGLKVAGEKPEAVLTDVGITLAFKKSKLIVYLDGSEKSWQELLKLKEKMGRLSPGIYDLRYNGMVVRGRKENA